MPCFPQKLISFFEPPYSSMLIFASLNVIPISEIPKNVNREVVDFV